MKTPTSIVIFLCYAQIFTGVFTACAITFTAIELYSISHSKLCFLLAAIFWVLGYGIIASGYKQLKASRTLPQDDDGKSELPLTTIEDRLDDLERLKRRDMVTPEEYAAKRQEILKDL
jgi:hypothetical protein